MKQGQSTSLKGEVNQFCQSKLEIAKTVKFQEDILNTDFTETNL